MAFILYNNPTLNNCFQINEQINQLINNQMEKELLNNITFLMRSFKDKNIQNQQLDYNSDRLSNLASNNDNGDINKQTKLKWRRWVKIFKKTWVGIFKNIDGNFSEGNHHEGVWLVGIFRVGVFLMPFYKWIQLYYSRR